MGDKGRRKDALRPLRRGVGLGLALVAVWGIGLTADLSGAWAALQRWASSSQAAVTLVAGELGQTPEDTVLAGLDGWGQLLVEQSAFLSAGTQAVAQRRQSQTEEVQSTPLPDLEAEDNDDQTQVELQPPAEPDDVVETTSVGQEGGRYLSQDGVYLYDRTGKALTPEVFSAGAVNFTLGEGPQILILHSHGSEAYSQNDGDLYQESDPYRTTDCSHMLPLAEEYE